MIKIEYTNINKGGLRQINNDLLNILKALAHENRLRLLNLLQQEELCVCELRNILGINQSNASRHLAKLRAAGLVNCEKREQWVYYSINQDSFKKYPFLEILVKEELENLEFGKFDREKLLKYQDSEVSCETLDESNIFMNLKTGGN